MNINPHSTRNLTALIFTAVMLMIFAPMAQAAINLNEDRQEIVSEFEVGPELSYITYEEPGVMEDTGVMYGVFGAYTARLPQQFVLGLDGRFMYGQVDYESTSTGTMDNIDDFILEFRGTAGYDIAVLESSRVTPYIGLGYRWLRDETGGRVSSTGASGYDRESNYFYLPIGVQTMTPLEGGWFIGLNAEFDVFLHGWQESELGDFFAGLDTLENDQDEGYGVRGSIKLAKSGERFNFYVEPFVRYWNIKQSDITAVTYGGTPIGVVGYEPKNNSTEIGARVGVQF